MSPYGSAISNGADRNRPYRTSMRPSGAAGQLDAAGAGTLRRLLDDMADGEDEHCHARSGGHNRQDNTSFVLSVGLELSGKRNIAEIFELSSPYELSKSRSPDILEVAGTRPTQCFIDSRVPTGKLVREIAPYPDGSCHQKERAD